MSGGARLCFRRINDSIRPLVCKERHCHRLVISYGSQTHCVKYKSLFALVPRGRRGGEAGRPGWQLGTVHNEKPFVVASKEEPVRSTALGQEIPEHHVSLTVENHTSSLRLGLSLWGEDGQFLMKSIYRGARAGSVQTAFGRSFPSVQERTRRFDPEPCAAVKEHTTASS